jgi:hypothetical protein
MFCPCPLSVTRQGLTLMGALHSLHCPLVQRYIRVGLISLWLYKENKLQD